MNEEIDFKIFEIRNYIATIGPVNCCVCKTLYRRLPKFNYELEKMNPQEIKDSFGKYCLNCKNWFCDDCMHINFLRDGCRKCKKVT